MKTASLLEDFENASGTEQRLDLLRRVELGWGLPDEELKHYYAVDPDAVRAYVDHQIDLFARWEDVPDTADFRDFLRDSDPEYWAELFRKTCLPDEWREQIEELSRSYEGSALVDELERVHPNRASGFDGAAVFERLLSDHGDAVVPYIRAHITEPWSHSSWEALIEKLEEDGRWDLWDAAVSGQASRDFDTYVRKILDRAEEHPGWARARLNGIAGASFWTWRERRTARLGTRVAEELYRRFPTLLKTTLDEHIGFDRLNARHHGYRTLIEEALRAGDVAYVDRLAGRYLSAALFVWGDTNHFEPVFSHLVEYYEEIDDDEAYAERANRVLSAFQPEDAPHWYTLRRNNPLHDIFFEQPERFGARPELITDLLESSHAPVRSLGFRALVATGDACGRLAAENVQLVMAAPLDRLSSPGMRAALRCIRAIAEHDPSLGGLVLNRLRDASSLAHPSFSRGELVRTMGHILKQSPRLRRASEQPDIYDYERTAGGTR